MSTEQTTVSLKEYFERIMAEKDKAINAALASAKEAVSAALAAAEKAVAVAERNAEKWRDNANEWRGAMTDREKTFMSRAEFEAYKESNDKIVNDLRTFINNSAGRREGNKDGWGYIIGAIGVVITVINFLK